MMNFGCVDYINALPLYLGGISPYPINIQLDHPSALLNTFLKTSSPKAHTPSVVLTSSLGTLIPSVSYLPDYGIAAYKNILSVNLYAKTSLFSYSSTPTQIAVTHESRSSIALLQILCYRLWEISPKIVRVPTATLLQQYSQYDGVLLIGDTALKNPCLDKMITYDLAYSWYELTQLPFVFASILVHTTFSQKHLIENFLETSLQEFEKDPSHVFNKAQQKSSLPLYLLKNYYSKCIYRLGEEEKYGLQTFQNLYKELLDYSQNTPHAYISS